MEEEMETTTNEEKIAAKKEWFNSKSFSEVIEYLVHQDMLLESRKENAETTTRSLYDLRNVVHTFFEDAFDGGDDSITVTKQEANELLSNCGCDELESEFTVTLTVEVTLSVQAPNSDTAIDMAKDSLTIDNDDTNITVDDWEVIEDSAEKSDY